VADAGLALHKALLAELGALSTPVYDGVPQGTAYPYITIDTSITSNIDHLVERLDERFVYLNVWSEARGQEEVLRIMGEIDALMHGAQFALDTGSLVQIRVERKSTQRDADNVTFTGTVTLRVITHH
jgi:hypothetical protein